MAKLVNINQLATFKQKQDAANEKKFIQAADFLDENGKIKSDKLATAEIIKIHVDSGDPANVKYFADDNGSKTTTEITGEVGKIYIDLESSSTIIYTFNGEKFVPFVSEIATDADIESLFNE